MKPPLKQPFTRVQIYKDSSWGGWVTVAETTDPAEVLQVREHYARQGYEVIDEKVT